jgi:hypothetical protein
MWYIGIEGEGARGVPEIDMSERTDGVLRLMGHKQQVNQDEFNGDHL